MYAKEKAMIQTTDDLIKAILEGVPIHYGCYGDGEFLCMMDHPIARKKRRNGQGELYTPQLRADLISTLEGRRLSLYGLFPGRVIFDEGVEWLKQNGWEHLPQPSGRLIRQAVHSGQGGKLIAALRTRRLLLVGPSHLSTSAKVLFNSWVHVEVPLINAHSYFHLILNDVLQALDDNQFDVICLSMGMSAAVLADRLLLHSNIARKVSILDCGASWDGYAGVYSRGKMGTLRYQRIMEQNLLEANECHLS